MAEAASFESWARVVLSAQDVLLYEQSKLSRQVGPGRIGEQFGDGGPIEGATDDGCPLCDDPFWRFELIES